MLCSPPAESGAALNRRHGWKGAKIKKSGLRGRLGRLLLLSWEELLSALCDITKGTRFQNSVFHQSPDKCSGQKKDGLFSFLGDIEDVWFLTALVLVCLICGTVQNDFTSLEFSPQALGLPWPLVFVPFVCDLPSAPPSSPSHLNSVGTPPPPPGLCVVLGILCTSR